MQQADSKRRAAYESGGYIAFQSVGRNDTDLSLIKVYVIDALQKRTHLNSIIIV